MGFKEYIILLLIVAVGYFWFRMRKYKQTIDDYHKSTGYLERKYENIELENIDTRLNQHLFKNVLNSIQSHVYQSYYTIEKLSNVLDYVLYKTPKQLVTPRDEINFIKSLIEINKIKLSPLFDLRTKILIDDRDPFLERKVIAPLVLIDLIENAFKHADVQSEDAFIAIVIELNNGYFNLSVSNKIAAQNPLKKENSGIGVSSLEKRLKKLYENRYKLQKSIDDKIYSVSLKIKLEE
ncbi:GHKL domain-containing protein [Paenimyroides ummariense]|uniref:GHKL domain-containing protein n=1 Tax=Paenimyroides ummariense TaxID=913024 RepID=A0A1I4W2W2_9FLAO|nr:histidine kinase [Paenimyroides ummariense]SFN07964.1 GHKL domain-containing protein [Paenimyroides ummariense]